MPPYFHQLTLPTPYGEATFGIEIAADGNVSVTALPLAGLPSSVLKLTYGNEWEAAQTYFRETAATLPYRIAALLFATDYPPELAALLSGYRNAHPEAQPGTDFAAFWAGHKEWNALFSFEESKLNAALDRFRQRGRHHELGAFTEYVLPYLISLFPVAGHRTAVLLHGAIGALGSESARNYLLGELESEGRHPFTTKILRALVAFSDQDTGRRLMAVYAAKKFDGDGLEEYLASVDRFGSGLVGDHVEQVLHDHPEQVEHVVTALQRLEYPDVRIARLLREEFERPQEYRDLDLLLRSTNALHVAESNIDLAAMNARVDDREYLELPPVNWPQQLEESWLELVTSTPPRQGLEVIASYLLRPEPRLQRNALLQLKVLLQDHPPTDPLPPEVEDRLRQLVASRFDKVYVEVLNVLGRRELPLRERAATLDAVLAVSIGSRYRFVVLTALRRIGNSADLKQRARRYLSGQIASAADEQRLEQIAGLLPFVEKYLGDVSGLRTQLSARRASSH